MSTTSSLPVDRAGEHVAQPPGGTSPRAARRSRVGAEAEQPPRLVVDHGHPAGPVEGDHALADAVQHRLALLQQRGDLVELEAERARASAGGRAASDATAPMRERDREPQPRTTGSCVPERAGHRALQDADGDLADPSRRPAPYSGALPLADGRWLPVVDADVVLAVERDDRLGDLLADQRRVGCEWRTRFMSITTT